MAEKSKSDGGVEPDPPDANVLNMLRDLQTAGFGATAMMGTAWVEAMSDLGAEVLSFVADRVKEDVRTQHEILHAKDVTEVQAIQARFIQQAVDQYSAETGKMVEMGQSALAKLPGTIIMGD